MPEIFEKKKVPQNQSKVNNYPIRASIVIVKAGRFPVLNSGK